MAHHNAELAEDVRRDYDQMLKRRQEVQDEMNTLFKFVLQRKPAFGHTPIGSSKRTAKGVDDDTAKECAEAAAAAYVGALWPNAGESFELIPHSMMETSPAMAKLLNTEEVKDYYAAATKKVRQPFSHADCGFLISLSEHMRENVVVGTSGIVGDEDEDDNINPCYFRSVSVETCLIEEGKRGRIDKVCFELYWTVRQVVATYGIENVSEHVKELNTTKEGQNQYVKLIHLIRARAKGKVGAPKLEKPWASIHMELDQNYIIKHDGQDYLTAWISRFSKRPSEVYGGSLASDALQTIKEANAIRRTTNLSLGIQLRPPIGFWTSYIGGADTIDLSEGAKVPLYNNKGMIESTRPPTERLMDIPEHRVANDRQNKIEERMMVKFQLDKLLDFNNKTRMTLGEARLRSDFRNQALGPYFSRQMTEVLHPSIMWAAEVHWRRKLLGYHPRKDAARIDAIKKAGGMPLVMPKVVADFWDATKVLPFGVRFVSPAARAMAADSLDGLEQFTNYALALVKGGAPEAMDSVNIDRSMELYCHHVGAPPEVLNAADKRDESRKRREAAQQAMLELQAGEQQSTIEKNRAKAAKDSSQAGIVPGGLSGAA